MSRRLAPLALGLSLLGVQFLVFPRPPRRTLSSPDGLLVVYAWPPQAQLTLSRRGSPPLQAKGSLTVPLAAPWVKPGTRDFSGVLTVTSSGYQAFSASNNEVLALTGDWIRLAPEWWMGLLLNFGWVALAVGLAASLRPPTRQAEDTTPRIGPYPLLGEPLQGAMGQVYPSVDEQGRNLALKVMHPQVSQSEEFRRRFLREAAICESLQHPALVKVYDHGEQQGRLYMAQEWVEGSSLDRLPLPQKPAHVKALLQQICQGLEAAHAEGIVHRDLKPANILLRRDGRAVIADFGLARGARYETITQTEATLGTPAYMPPEQIRGLRSGPRADLYSLGCIAYLLLTGRLPFHHQDPIPLMLLHLNQAPVPTGLSPAWDELLLALLAKDPEQRPASAGEVLKRLEALPTNAGSEG